MFDWKKITKGVLFLPLWSKLLLTMVSVAGLVLVFLKGWEEHIGAVVIYVLSAYMLTVWCFFFVCVFPPWLKGVRQKFAAHPYGNKYLTDVGYKVRVSLYISLGINLLYSVFKLASGIYYSSFWWGAIAVYYILLSVIRFLLLRYMRSDGQNVLGDWKRYRQSGAALLMIHLSLVAIVLQMVFENKGVLYPEVIVIAAAAYTFYTVIMSIRDLIKYRRYQNPAYAASKAIRFAAALVSLLTTETAMLARYGEDEGFRKLMTAITGMAVCAIVLVMSVYMIVKGSVEIARRSAKGEEK